MNKFFIILLERNAEKSFKKIPEVFHNKIISAILELKKNSKPQYSKKIRGVNNYYRIKIGDYRVVYEVKNKEKIINIFIIRHRKDAYFSL